MKSGGPWNLRGLLPGVREAARTAARQSGMSVGEWLNSVIKVVDEEDGELAPSNGFDRFSDYCSRQSARSDNRWHRDADCRDRTILCNAFAKKVPFGWAIGPYLSAG